MKNRQIKLINDNPENQGEDEENIISTNNINEVLDHINVPFIYNCFSNWKRSY